MLINLKSRGLENLLLFVSDGLDLHEPDGLLLKETLTYIFSKAIIRSLYTKIYVRI